MVARDPKAAGQCEEEEEEEEGTPAEVLVEAVEAIEGRSEGSGEASDGVKVKKEESGRWEVVDGKGKARYFDEVRVGGGRGLGSAGGVCSLLVSMSRLSLFA